MYVLFAISESLNLLIVQLMHVVFLGVCKSFSSIFLGTLGVRISLIRKP